MIDVSHHIVSDESDYAEALPDIWQLVVLARCEGPPLRFRGRRIAHQRRQVAAQKGMFIDVWARKRGDYVVAYSNVQKQQIKPDAWIVRSLSDIPEHLEDSCSELPQSLQIADPASGLMSLIEHIAMQQHFALLVGDFLASFESYSARQSRALADI